MITSVEEHTRRRQMYNSNMTDQEMSEACFVCLNAIKYWRETQNPPLPPNSKKCERLELRVELYKSGLTDDEIAKAQKCSRMAIRDWRKKRKLPQNKKEGSRVYAGR